MPLDRQQCQDFLGRSGSGWLSRPGASSVPRRLTSYTVASGQLRLVPECPAVLPAGEIVMFQVAHFDARAGTAWSVVLVGPSAGCALEPGRPPRGSVPPLALHLGQVQIFGSTLAAASDLAG